MRREQTILAPLDGKIIVFEAQEAVVAFGHRVAKRVQHGSSAANARIHERLPLREKRLAHIVQQSGAAFSQKGDAMHVQHETVRLHGEPHQIAHDEFGAVEADVTLKLKTACTSSAATARSRVTGLTPPFASVAARQARSRHVTSAEHWRK